MKIAQLTSIFASFSCLASGTLLADELNQQFNKEAKWTYFGELKSAGKELAVVSKGEAMIANFPIKGNRKRVPFLQTKEKFQDVHMKLEFMVPKGSN
jgi:hypothetical protein